MQSNIYLSNLNKLLFYFFIVQSFIGCSKEKIDKRNDIEIGIVKKERLDDNNLLLTISFKNHSNKNYVIPNYFGYYLVHSMDGNKKYDASGKIGGKIITSEFYEKLDDKWLKLLYLYYNNTFYKKDKCNKLSDVISFNDLTYTSSILFLPHETERRITLVFNGHDFNQDTFTNKNTRLSLGLDLSNNFKILDSLLKKEKIDYTIYNKDLILKDSLFINK